MAVQCGGTGCGQHRRRYDAFFLDAICQREKGNNDAAFDLLRHCVDIDSTRSEAYYYLAQYYAALKQKDTALSYSKKAVELEPDNVDYLETLANAYIEPTEISGSHRCFGTTLREES